MTVVLDTNVIISGIFFTGPPKAVIEAWIDSRIEVAVSLAILDEYRRVASELGRKYPQVQASDSGCPHRHMRDLLGRSSRGASLQRRE